VEQHVTIELFGQPYTFKTQSELSQAREVADFLVREVAKVSDYYPNKSAKMNHVTIMILAALNIAQEYLELEKDRSNFINTISDRSAELIRKIDDCFIEPERAEAYRLQTGT
jgi:cell division protein ZapA (FtsZ GTPase activity inhibitor)